jgi:hypothetical protein
MADHGDPTGDRLRQLYELFLQRRRAWKDERSRVKQMGTVVAYLNLSYVLPMLAANGPMEGARVRQMAIVVAQLNQIYVRKRHEACREATRLLELEMVLAELNHAYAQSRREEETGAAAGPEGDDPGVANAPEDDANDNPGVPNAPDCRDGQA